MSTPVTRLPLVTTELDALLRQVARRDADAFASFYDRTRARVFGLVTRVVRDPGYSEETRKTSICRCGVPQTVMTRLPALRWRGC
jgi:hypothetical protein